MALRWATRHPILLFVVAATLGLGVGVNATVFAMIDALLLRELPYREPSKLVLINRAPLQLFFSSTALFQDWKKSTGFLVEAALFVEGEANVFGGSEPVHIRVANVSANLFSLLGTMPEVGRTFHVEEQAPGQNRTVLLSHRLWQRQFGSDEAVVGRKLRMNGKDYEIVGVLPLHFAFPEGVDAWLPSAHDPIELRAFGSVGRFVLGRMPGDISVERANAIQAAWMLGRVSADKLPPHKSPYWRQPFVRSLRDELVGTLRTPALMIWGAALLVLLIGCINAAHLLLASFAARQHDFAVRRAVGMSTVQLVRQLLLEQLVTGLAAGAVGLLLARWLTAGVTMLLPVSWPKSAVVTVDLRVFLFTVGLSVLVGTLVAVQPSWQLGRDAGSLPARLLGGRRAGESLSERKWRLLLNATQTAFVTVLLVGSGLFIRTLINLQRVDSGYRPDKLLCLSVSRPDAGFRGESERARQYYSEVLRALASVPGVESASGQCRDRQRKYQFNSSLEQFI